MMTRAGLDLQLREAYARAGQPLPAEPGRVLRWHGDARDARDVAIVAITFAVVVGAFALVLARALAGGPDDGPGDGGPGRDDFDYRPPGPGGLQLAPFVPQSRQEEPCSSLA
jgi:hypothetical protein